MKENTLKRFVVSSESAKNTCYKFETGQEAMEKATDLCFKTGKKVMVYEILNLVIPEIKVIQEKKV